MKQLWYHAPLDERNWPLWAPVLWPSDFRKKPIYDWLVDVFHNLVVFDRARRQLVQIVGSSIYEYEKHASPGEQAAAWHFLRRSLGYTKEVDWDG